LAVAVAGRVVVGLLRLIVVEVAVVVLVVVALFDGAVVVELDFGTAVVGVDPATVPSAFC